MPRLTKRKALTLCRELWLWLAENPEAEKREWPGWKEVGSFDLHCPCCEYSKRHNDAYCENINFGCLISWGTYKNSCLNPGSAFMRWDTTINPQTRKEAALQMVALCDDALANLPKRRKK